MTQDHSTEFCNKNLKTFQSGVLSFCVAQCFSSTRMIYVQDLSSGTILHTVGELKDLTLHRTIVVKLPQLRAALTEQGSILPIVRWIDFFLGPWLLVYQSIEISNQMESNGEVSNFEMKILCNSVLHNFFYPKFDTSPFDSI